MEIRKMELKDYEEAYRLWMACPGMGLNDLDDSQEGIARFLERNPDTCFVALEETQIIGCVMAGIDGRRAYIYHTAVHPEHQRRGIGALLVDQVIGALEEMGIHKAALVVFKRNEAGNGFWEKMGFTPRTDIVYRNRAFHEMKRIDT